MSNIKNQHYVPRFYLKGFSNEKLRVWAFDKTTAKSFPSNSGNLASENYFYDDKEIDEIFGAKFIEKSLGDIEDRIAPLLTRLLDNFDNRKVFKIDKQTKAQLCEYMSIQILRTKEHRQSILQMFTLMEQTLVEKSWLTQQQVKSLGFQMDPERAKSLQISHLLPGKSLKMELVNSLNAHICVIYKNTTQTPFYASDHPIAKRAHIINPVRSFSGYSSKGIEISFPLSSKYILVLCERSMFQNYEQYENEVLILNDPQNIIYYNSLQVRDSYRYVYCAEDNFDLAKEMVETHKELGDVSRKRSEIG